MRRRAGSLALMGAALLGMGGAAWLGLRPRVSRPTLILFSILPRTAEGREAAMGVRLAIEEHEVERSFGDLLPFDPAGTPFGPAVALYRVEQEGTRLVEVLERRRASR